MIKAAIKSVEGNDAPATHGIRGTSGHWRAGETGYAECNPSEGKPRLVMEWLVTGWRNSDLKDHPFFKLTPKVSK